MRIIILLVFLCFTVDGISQYSDSALSTYERILLITEPARGRSAVIRWSINIDNNFIQLKAHLFKSQPGKYIYGQWLAITAMVTRLTKNDYETIDYNRVTEAWQRLKSEMMNQKAYIFPDTSLKRVLDSIRSNVASIRIDSAPSFSNVQFFKYANEELKKIKDTVSIHYRWAEQVLFDTLATIDSLIRNPLFTNIDSIKYYLYKRDTSVNLLIVAGAYPDNVFSVGGIYVFDKSKKKQFPISIGTELIFPFSSPVSMRAGGFISLGFQSRNLVFLMGPGIVYRNTTGYTGTWKGSVYYLTSRWAGAGISYSPTTGIGIYFTVNPFKIKL